MRYSSAVFCVVASMLSSSCSLQRVVFNDPLGPEDVEFIVPTKTTMAEVVERMGAPDDITGVEDFILFRYDYRSVKSVRIDFGGFVRIWSPVSPPLNYGWGNGSVDVVIVAFDRDWIATTLTMGRLNEASKASFWPF